MAKVSLAFWFIFEAALALLSRFAESPYGDLFFVGTIALLAYMTVRSVLGEAQKECQVAGLHSQFDEQLTRMLRQQRANLIASFERQVEKKFEKDPNEPDVLGDHRLKDMDRFRDRVEKTRFGRSG